MVDSTAMTVDFLRARLLSERSVSRAAKERADQLAMRVAELEEQVRAVTAQRRQAELAATEVLAILESQGFGGHLSDAVDDSGSERGGGDAPRDATSGGGKTCSQVEEQGAAAAQGAPEDAVSGTAAQPGGLSWKGRSVSPRKARQLKQKHWTDQRSYFYFLSSSDSSPKYRMGQSCRKNKRQELRSAPLEEDGGNAALLLGDSLKRQQDASDCTDDGQADLEGEVGADERSSGDSGGGGQYVIRYEKDGGEMERVLERQAELIGQYEAEEEAQREWEKQFNQCRNSSKGDVRVEKKAYQPENGQEAQHKEEAKSIHRNLASSISPPNASEQQSATRRHEADEKRGHDSAQSAVISAEGSSDDSTVTRQDQDQGDENSDGYSSYHANPPSFRPSCATATATAIAIRAPSDGSPSGDSLNRKALDWGSSHSHDHADSQLDDTLTRSHSHPQPSSSVDVGGVLEALRRAKMSLSVRLSRPVPPSQVMLALPAPGDDDRTDQEDDDAFPVDDEYNFAREELCGSSPSRQEMLALPAPEDFQQDDGHGRTVDRLPGDNDGADVSSPPRRQEILALPAPGDECQSETEEDCARIPPITISAAGLFRLPTDTFPKDEMPSSSISAYDLGFSLREPDRRSSAFSSAARHTSGRCHVISSSDFTIGSVTEDLRRGRPLGNADLFMQRGCDYTISNKWML